MANASRSVGVQGNGKRIRDMSSSLSAKGRFSCRSHMRAAHVKSQSREHTGNSELFGGCIDSRTSTMDVEPCTAKEPSQSKLQYTDGPVRFTIADDGSRDVVALLVTDRLIQQLNKLTRLSRHLDEKEDALEKMTFEINSLEDKLERLGGKLQIADHTDGQQLDAEVKECQSKLTETRQLHDVLDKKILFDKDNLSFARGKNEAVFEEAMKEANLLEAPEAPAGQHGLMDSERKIPAVEPDSLKSKHLDLKEDVKMKRAARQECAESWMRAADIQADFDYMPMKYRENLALYEQNQADGIFDMPRSEFDRLNIRYGQNVTKALIEAEAQYDKAKERAEAMGAFEDGWDDESYYGDSQCSERTTFPVDTPEMQDCSFLSAKRRKVIASWNENVGGSRATGVERTAEIDGWEARPVEISDSISVVASGSNKRKIESWKAQCQC